MPVPYPVDENDFSNATKALLNAIAEGGGGSSKVYVYPTQAAYEADKANVPDGARVVLLDKYPDNHLMVERPDYAKMESTNRIAVNNGTWVVDRLGFVYLRGAVGIASGSTGYIPHVWFT
jgi:hypothetical protein